MPAHGSLQNLMYAQSTPAVPQVGDGATIIWWTDREPATVIRVSPSGKTIWIQDDTATRTDKNGMSESQSYTFDRDPEGFVQAARLRKDGKWHTAGGNVVLIGHRGKYHDYSF